MNVTPEQAIELRRNKNLKFWCSECDAIVLVNNTNPPYFSHKPHRLNDNNICTNCTDGECWFEKDCWKKNKNNERTVHCYYKHVHSTPLTYEYYYSSTNNTVSNLVIGLGLAVAVVFYFL